MLLFVIVSKRRPRSRLGLSCLYLLLLLFLKEAGRPRLLVRDEEERHWKYRYEHTEHHWFRFIPQQNRREKLHKRLLVEQEQADLHAGEIKTDGKNVDVVEVEQEEINIKSDESEGESESMLRSRTSGKRGGAAGANDEKKDEHDHPQSVTERQLDRKVAGGRTEVVFGNGSKHSQPFSLSWRDYLYIRPSITFSQMKIEKKLHKNHGKTRRNQL